MMKTWLANYFPDFWMHPDVLDSGAQFLAEISQSDDPPETLPRSDILEAKDLLDKQIGRASCRERV